MVLFRDTRRFEITVEEQADLWVAYDWCRIAMMAAGFLSALRAISMPVPIGAPLSRPA